MRDSGGGGRGFPVTRSILSEDSLRELVERDYDVGTVRACTLLGPTTNDHYLLETEGDRYVLRVYCAGRRSPSDVAYELDALVYLRGAGTPVAFPIPDRDGRLSRIIDAPEGERTAVLFSHAPGTPAARALPDDRMARLCGEVLAEIHSASDDFATSHSRPALDLEYLLDQPLRRVELYLSHRSEDWTYITSLADRLRWRLAPLVGELDRGFCHGDFHGWNVHVAEDGTAIAFDFDCCGPGWRAYDLATFQHSLGLDPAKIASWAPFLQGYTERRPVGPADAAAIAPLVALCELWVMGGRIARVPDWGILGIEDRMNRGVRFLKRWETEHLDASAPTADRTIE